MMGARFGWRAREVGIKERVEGGLYTQQAEK